MTVPKFSVPDLATLFQKLANDLKTNSPEADPFLQSGVLNSELIAFAVSLNSCYQLFDVVVQETFDATATGEYLESRGSELGITRNPATQSKGYVSFKGTTGTLIPSGTELSDSSGNLFVTQAESGVNDISKSVDLSPDNGVVTVDFDDEEHKLGNGFEITISGASESDLNGTFACTVIDAYKVSYEITNTTLADPDTGTCDYSLADVYVKSKAYGVINNKAGGSIISLSAPIGGIETDGVVQYGGLTGASDEETDEELRVRIETRRKNPVTHFNDNVIILKALEISYVSNVFVINANPLLGQVTIYVIKDDEEPLAEAELEEVKNSILEIKPANTADEDVIVSNPVFVTTDFEFTALEPNTASMKKAIIDNLQSLFEDADISTSITKEEYNRAILNTVDPSTFNRVRSYTLAEPTDDIEIADGELARLGDVTYDL